MDFEIIIYTKNRAMQLDLLLRSMELNIVDYEPQKVWLFYVPPLAGHGYVKLANRFKDLNLRPQKNFRKDLKSLVNEIKSKYVLGLCDDYVFINKLDINLPYLLRDPFPGPDYMKCVNLFLVPGMSLCFSQDREMEVGKYHYNTDGFWWNWTLVNDKKSDWAYPHNVAGHIYRTDYFRQMLRWAHLMSWEVSRRRGLNFVNWQGLNTLEKAMSRWRRASSPYMVGLFSQTLLHIAINTVQTEYAFNQVGKKQDQSQDALAVKYLDGYQIKLEPFLNKKYNANGVKDVTFEFEKQA